MRSADSDRSVRDRELVRRTALVLSADLPLNELFDRLCFTLSTYVDASYVLVAASEDGTPGRVEYIYSGGIGSRPADSAVDETSNIAHVLRTGESLLYRTSDDWRSRGDVCIAGHPELCHGAIFVPIQFGGTILGVLSAQSSVDDAYDRDDVAVLETCALYLGARMNQAHVRERAALADTDSLTGIASRRRFDEVLEREWQRSARSGTYLALLMIDVDYFKAFNDTYGHVAGDTCLQQIAHGISAAARRPADLVARYGGEEFVVVLPETELSGALAIAETVSERIRQLNLQHARSTLGHVSVSVGVAAMRPESGQSPSRLIGEADAALYRAKNSGRNRVAAGEFVSQTLRAEPRAAVPHPIPATRDAFVGRTDVLAAIEEALAHHQVVTLVGPHGSGKTRTALELARRRGERYPDGACYVDLSLLEDGSTIATAVADALRISSMGNAAAAVVDALSQKHLLLVLDDGSHVREACMKLVRAIADAAITVEILVTAHEPLDIEVECTYHLPPLTLGESIELFGARARARLGSFEMSGSNVRTLAQIAERLAFSPFALELVAARLSIFEIEEVARMFPLPAHPSVRKVLDWSYALLSASEQAMYRKLSVFPGGWTREYAVAICGEASTLESLVAKALVEKFEARNSLRFRFSRLVRDHARALLEENGEAQATRDRFGRYMISFVTGVERQFQERNFAHAMHALLDERENLRDAVQWSLEEPLDIAAFATVCRALRYFLWERGPADYPGLDAAIVALVRRDGVPPDAEAELWRALSDLQRFSEPRRAGEAAERALALFERLADPIGAAHAIYRVAYADLTTKRGVEHSLEERMRNLIGRVQDSRDLPLEAFLLNYIGTSYLSRMDQDELAQARSLFDRAAQLMIRVHSGEYGAVFVGNSAYAEYLTGDAGAAVAKARIAIDLSEQSGQLWVSAVTYANLGLFLIRLENAQGAREALRRALAELRTTGRMYWIASVFDYFAHLGEFVGDLRRSLLLMGYADTLFTRGVDRQSPIALLRDALYDRICDELGADEAARTLAAGRDLDEGQAIAEAYLL